LSWATFWAIFSHTHLVTLVSASKVAYPRRLSDRVAKFFLVQNTKTGKMYQISTKNTKWPLNISNGRKIDEMIIKYTKMIFHSKTHENLPKLGFLVLKQTIWQPCLATD
jgi:hypothetical protein